LLADGELVVSFGTKKAKCRCPLTWSRNGFACPSTAEAFSIYAAMVLAAAAGGFRDVIFESVIEKLKSKRTGDRTYLRYGRLVTPRQGNQVAHCLAHLAHSD
jgi:hypothetical protein